MGGTERKRAVFASRGDERMSESDIGRRAFLARVQAGIERGDHRPESADSSDEHPQPDETTPTETLIGQFAAALQAVDGQAIIVEDADSARQAILEALQAWEARHVFVARSTVIEDLELSELLQATDLVVAEQAADGTLLGGNGEGRSVRDYLATADVGITGVDLAIAQTGTLVLTAAPGHPRMASALPPRHLAVVRAEQIVPALADVVPRLKEQFLQPDGSWSTSCISLITGPSRTADIEQTLTVGVHGPRELLAVVIR